MIARAVHAYEPHDYADAVAVVGAGMAAATEWLNALAAGAQVVSVRRREPVRRPLNLPRAALLAARPGAIPRDDPRRARGVLLRASPLPPIRPGETGTSRSSVRRREGASASPPRSTARRRSICATGFRRGFRHDPLLARLVDEHGLETEGRWIVLAPDSHRAAR